MVEYIVQFVLERISKDWSEKGSLVKDINQKIEYTLNAENIDAIADKIEEICDSNKFDPKRKTRVRLSVEESLGIWMERLGEGRKVVFEYGRKLLKPYFQISVEGESFNPYDAHDEDFGIGGKSLLISIGLIPVYSYAGGCNNLTFTIRRKRMNQGLFLMIIVAAALAVGFLGKMYISSKIIGMVTLGFINPVEEAFFNVLKAFAGPMVFLSVAWGIYGIGDVYMLGRVGKKLMSSFLIVVIVSSVFGALFFSLFDSGIVSRPTRFSQLSSIMGMLLGIFPDNIFSPFIDGNTLQIIFLAFVIGLSMIFLGQRTSSIARAVEQINNIINLLMSFMTKLVPYFVFIVLVQLIWSGKYEVLLDVWKLALIYVLAYILWNIAFLLYTAVINRENPIPLLKACLPSFAIGLTTASSAATFETSMAVCHKQFGIENSLSSFSIPFGMVMFKPNTSLYYTIFCFYIGIAYSVEITFSWMVVAVLVSVVCAIATPPIPGGAAAAYTMLFLQLGIPSDAIAIALAVDIVFDFLLTAGDMFCLLLGIFSVSGRLGMRKEKNLE